MRGQLMTLQVLNLNRLTLAFARNIAIHVLAAIKTHIKNASVLALDITNAEAHLRSHVQAHDVENELAYLVLFSACA